MGSVCVRGCVNQTNIKDFTCSSVATADLNSSTSRQQSSGVLWWDLSGRAFKCAVTSVVLESDANTLPVAFNELLARLAHKQISTDVPFGMKPVNLLLHFIQGALYGRAAVNSAFCLVIVRPRSLLAEVLLLDRKSVV